MTSALEFDAVTYAYPTGPEFGPYTHVLEWGTSCALVGRSGTGKSTILALAALVLEPRDGRVVLSGKDLSRASVRDRDLWRGQWARIIWQDAGLIPYLTAWENVAAQFGPPRERHRPASIAALEAVGMARFADEPPERLSGGQRQRVGVARGLVGEPGVLLADEPTANLDAASAILVAEAITAVTLRGGAALIATHDPELSQTAHATWRLEAEVLG